MMPAGALFTLPRGVTPLNVVCYAMMPPSAVDARYCYTFSVAVAVDVTARDICFRHRRINANICLLRQRAAI